jgi:hypothetical protein
VSSSPTSDANLTGPYGTYFGDAEETESFFSKQFNMMLFNTAFQGMKKRHHRSYGDICDGKKAYTETVFYRIEKSLNGEVIQNIWLPNVEGQKKLNYIDTQVKYGLGYDYNIFAYKIVFGSKYKYDFHVTDKVHPTMKEDIAPDIGGNLFSWGASWDTKPKENDIFGRSTFTAGQLFMSGYWTKKNADGIPEEFATYMDAIVEQEVLLVEVPYYGDNSTIYDDPPMPPEVEIIPYKDVSTRILISFSPDSGERDLQPIIINDGEQELINKIRLAQDRIFKDQNENFLEPLIRYKSDDFPLAYETYRTIRKPKTYKDFHNHMIRSTSAAASSGFIDIIVPNIKYYYMFRTVDRHGKFSNPSPVYMFEMVDGGGALYPILSVIDLEERSMNNKDHSRDMKRHIQIQPAIAQALLNEDASGITSETAHSGIDPVLGIAAESIWNDKKFKVRLTSRSTGRQIDLNVNFITKHSNHSKLKPRTPTAAGRPVTDEPRTPKFYTGRSAFNITEINIRDIKREQKGNRENGAPRPDSAHESRPDEYKDTGH